MGPTCRPTCDPAYPPDPQEGQTQALREKLRAEGERARPCSPHRAAPPRGWQDATTTGSWDKSSEDSQLETCRAPSPPGRRQDPAQVSTAVVLALRRSQSHGSAHQPDRAGAAGACGPVSRPDGTRAGLIRNEVLTDKKMSPSSPKKTGRQQRWKPPHARPQETFILGDGNTDNPRRPTPQKCGADGSPRAPTHRRGKTGATPQGPSRQHRDRGRLHQAPHEGPRRTARPTPPAPGQSLRG